jgi:hypothetical protein
MPSFTRRSFSAALVFAAAAAPLVAAAQIAPEQPNLGPPARTLRELVDRYTAWRGPAFGQLQSLHERAYFESAAGRKSGSVWMDRDGRRRVELDGSGGKEIRAATPDGAWRSDGAGAPADDPGAWEAARRYAALEFGDALMGRDGAQAQLTGTAEAEDHTWSVVRVTFGDADTYDALIDPSIGLLYGYRITEKGVAREITFVDWRLVDGVRLPFAQLTRQGADVSGVRLAAVEINPPLSDALFRRPG